MQSMHLDELKCKMNNYSIILSNKISKEKGENENMFLVIYSTGNSVNFLSKWAYILT